MGLLFGATRPIISKRVGEGGQKSGKDVKRINQLLNIASFLTNLPADPTLWTKESAEALIKFQKATGVGTATPYIDKIDPFDRLFALALTAGVLVPLPTGLRSTSALSVFFNHCKSANYPYGWKKNGININGGTKTIFGFEGRPNWAVVVNLEGFFSPEFRVSMNCTSFANLALSVWMQGNAHTAPYDGSQMVGGFESLGSRYGLHPVNDGKLMFDGFCYDIDGILQNAKPGRLYHIGSCRNDGFMTHDVVLLDGIVYECNEPPGTAVRATPVKERFGSINYDGRGVRMYGPMPF